jgi:hypothetical protein
MFESVSLAKRNALECLTQNMRLGGGAPDIGIAFRGWRVKDQSGAEVAVIMK